MRIFFLLLTLGFAALPYAQDLPGWAIGPFEKEDAANPILLPDTSSRFYCPIREDIVRWEGKDVFNPCAVVRNGKVYLLYRAEDFVGKHLGTSRIGLAVSEDGIHFERHGTPVLYPDNDPYKPIEWEGGVEDPRIVEGPDGRYYMTYTAYNGEGVNLSIASSDDLLHWTKHGVIDGIGDKVGGWDEKAGMILTEVKDGRLIAKQIDGKYWMYWGVSKLRMATSENLYTWERLRAVSGQDSVVLRTREDHPYTDNQGVEAGPAAVWTPGGIVACYNGIFNGPEDEPVTMTWAGSQALFAADDPTRLIDRLERPYLQPDRPYELDGQVNNVTFTEGLVLFKGRWFVYYGTADSKIAVAVAQR
jgi:predicted GH43/DUF377 family glycosyl hydrolase